MLKEISRYIDVAAANGNQCYPSGDRLDNDLLALNETELGLLHYGAYFIYSPEDTVDHDPVRTFSPVTEEEIKEQRLTFRKHLPDHLDTWNDFFLYSVVPCYREKYDLPDFDNRYDSRLGYVVDIFRALERQGPIFVKCPKWLNDFSGYTLRLFDELMVHEVPIKGIYLYRCPANTYTSIFERKMRLHEVCGGNLEQYSEYVLESVEYSVEKGMELVKKYEFFTINYEDMVDMFPSLMAYLGIEAYRNPAYRRKYGRRYLLNPRARNSLHRLSRFGEKLGYRYPKNVTFWMYAKELIFTVSKTVNGQHKDVNNPETAWSVLQRCFWYEIDTPRLLPLKKIYRWVRKREK